MVSAYLKTKFTKIVSTKILLIFENVKTKKVANGCEGCHHLYTWNNVKVKQIEGKTKKLKNTTKTLQNKHWKPPFSP